MKRTLSTGSRTAFGAVLFVLALPVAMAYPRPITPEALVTVTIGEVKLGLPQSWQEVKQPKQDTITSMWSPQGKDIFGAKAFLLIHRSDTNKLKLDDKREKILEDQEMKIGKRTFRRLLVSAQADKGNTGEAIIPSARLIGLVDQNPGKDGRYLAFLFAADSSQWTTYGPLYERIIQSIQIDGEGGGPVSDSIIKVTGSDRAGTNPLAGANVIIGKRISLAPITFNYSGKDSIIGDVIFQEGITAGNGTYTPNPALPPGTYHVIVWKAGYVPQQNTTVTIPGATVTVSLGVDSGPGSSGRHLSLDTSGVFRMQPPNGSQPMMWGRITQSDAIDRTKSVACGDAVIVVGENLSIVDKYNPKSTGFSIDLVQGDVIYAVEKTKADGTFTIPIPVGNYSVIIWKKGAFVPYDKQQISVWPGQVFYRLSADELPGQTGRHLELDLTSLGIPRKTLDNRPGIRGVIRVSDRGVRKPLAGATVLLGQELRLKGEGATDIVTGRTLIATTLTNEQGEYYIAAGPGTYQMVFWARGCIPQQFDTVTIPPGVSNVTLIKDHQPGTTGRHQKLDTSGILKPATQGTNNQQSRSTLETIISFIVATQPAIPELVPVKIGNVTLKVPTDFRRDTGTPVNEGVWYRGPAAEPELSISLLRDVSFDGLIEQLVQPTTEEITGTNPAGKLYRGKIRDSKSGQARLLIWPDPDAAGKLIALSIQTSTALSQQDDALLDAIQSSVVITTQTVEVPKPELKELHRTTRIPGFEQAYSIVCYEDRIWIRDVTNQRDSYLGVAGAGKAVGSAFKTYLSQNPIIARELGEAVTSSMTTLKDQVTIQIFETGVIVLEKSSGTIWSQAHTTRPKNLRPRDEMTRYPQVRLLGKDYAIAISPSRVVIEDLLQKKSMGISADWNATTEKSEMIQKIIVQEKIDARLGRVLSAEQALFDTAYRVQIFEGGVVVVMPGSDRYWWCTHSKRTNGSTTTTTIELPKDPNAVVIKLDYVGGYTPPRKTNAPYLEIRADGKVTLTDPYGKQPKIQTQLKPENLDDFLKFAIEEQKFNRLDTTRLKKSIDDLKKIRKLPTITDLPTTVIAIRTADGVHEVRCYAPQFYAENLPELKELQQYEKIHARLANYMEKLRSNP